MLPVAVFCSCTPEKVNAKSLRKTTGPEHQSLILTLLHMLSNEIFYALCDNVTTWLPELINHNIKITSADAMKLSVEHVISLSFKATISDVI